MKVCDILVDTLTFPIATGQDETRRDAIETLDASSSQSGLSAGANDAGRVQRVVRTQARSPSSPDFGLSHRGGRGWARFGHRARLEDSPDSRIPEEQYQAAMDLVYDRREYDANGDCIVDPLRRFLDVLEDVDTTSSPESVAESLAAMPVGPRLQRRIVDGERIGLEADLDEALDDTHSLGDRQ